MMGQHADNAAVMGQEQTESSQSANNLSVLIFTRWCYWVIISNGVGSDVNKANSVKAKAKASHCKAKVKVSHFKDKIKVVYLNTTA